MEPAGCVFVAGSAPRCTRSGSRDVDSIVSRLLACRLLNSNTPGTASYKIDVARGLVRSPRFRLPPRPRG